ncbi:hypothetical protein MMC13_001736 [Lambiella insularis]|nr:hypothetical protein [Lambiella insularis]
MVDGEAIIKKAYLQLRATATPEDARRFQHATLADVWRVAREIEREQGDRLSLRNMKRLEPILKTMETYAGVLDTGPIKFILLVARQYDTVMDKVLQALKDIADVLPRADRLKAVFSDVADFERVVALLYSDILEFLQRVYKFLRRRAWHIYFAFDWGLFERRFKSILQRLAAHSELLDKEAAAIHYSEMKTMRDARLQENEDFEQRRQRIMVQDVFTWLSAAENVQEEYLHQLADVRQLGTCNWILDHDDVYSWIEDNQGHTVLWMTGIPGAGKSFLCSLIVEHLESRSELSTLYYFCGQKTSQDSCSTILRTLALQLLRQNIDMVPLVHEAYLQKGASRSSQGIKKILRETLSNVKSARIVVDGLDECHHSLQKEVLGSLLDVQKHSGDSCKILVSSRPEPQINKALPRKVHVTLQGKTTEALNLFIEHNVAALRLSFPTLDNALFDRAQQRMQHMAKGMFLWVRLVSTMLRQQSSDLEFEDAIERLPDGLDEAYGRILSRIRELSPILKERAFKILYWVCVSRRPVKIHEVADGIALKPGQAILSRRTRILDINRDVLEVCAPIVEMSNGNLLDLVHFSTKEYLLDLQSRPFVDVAQAHLSIAFSCISNLAAGRVIIPRFADGTSEIDTESLVVQEPSELGCSSPDIDSSTTFIMPNSEKWRDRFIIQDCPGKEVESLCDQEIQGSMVRYPDFAAFRSDCPLFPEAFVRSSDELEGLSGVQKSGDKADLTVHASHYCRIPYWSKSEKEWFSKLVERHGRDHAKIADCLKTKTVEEIKQHFLQLLSDKEGDFINLVEIIDSRTKAEMLSCQTSLECEAGLTEISSMSESEESDKPKEMVDAYRPNDHSSIYFVPGDGTSTYGENRLRGPNTSTKSQPLETYYLLPFLHIDPASINMSLFSLPPSLRLSFLAEGGANIVYRMHLRPSTPPSSSAFLSSDDEYGHGTPPPTEIDFPYSPPNWNHILKNRLLRLRKALPTATPIREAQAYLDEVITKLFEPEQLVAQKVVLLPLGLVAQCNADLRAIELEGRRAQTRKGQRLDESSDVGLVVQDMSAEGWEGEGDVACLEFKPKWLAQSPSAPLGARRCRTCALREMRLAEKGGGAERMKIGWCPLDLVSGQKSRVGGAVGRILSANEPGSEETFDKALQERIVDWILQGRLLQRLRDAQVRFAQQGISDGGKEGTRYRTTMTLRDCTLFLRISREGKGQVEARLGDLDLKSATKAENWEATERKLRAENWYAANGHNRIAESTVCLLAEND